jgi:hypothetical protein
VSEEDDDTHSHENNQLPHELGNGKTLVGRLMEKRKEMASLGTISKKFRSEFKFSYVRLAIFTIGHS